MLNALIVLNCFLYFPKDKVISLDEIVTQANSKNTKPEYLLLEGNSSDALKQLRNDHLVEKTGKKNEKKWSLTPHGEKLALHANAYLLEIGAIKED